MLYILSNSHSRMFVWFEGEYDFSEFFLYSKECDSQHGINLS